MTAAGPGAGDAARHRDPQRRPEPEQHAEHPADGARAEDEAEHARPDVQHAHRVEREQRQEHQVEQVDDRDRGERRADDRGAGDEPQARGHAIALVGGRRLGRADAAEKEGRARTRRPAAYSATGSGAAVASPTAGSHSPSAPVTHSFGPAKYSRAAMNTR